MKIRVSYSLAEMLLELGFWVNLGFRGAVNGEF